MLRPEDSMRMTQEREGWRPGGTHPAGSRGFAPTDENQIRVLLLRHRFGGPGHVTHVTGGGGSA